MDSNCPNKSNLESTAKAQLAMIANLAINGIYKASIQLILTILSANHSVILWLDHILLSVCLIIT